MNVKLLLLCLVSSLTSIIGENTTSKVGSIAEPSTETIIQTRSLPSHQNQINVASHGSVVHNVNGQLSNANSGTEQLANNQNQFHHGQNNFLHGQHNHPQNQASFPGSFQNFDIESIGKEKTSTNGNAFDSHHIVNDLATDNQFERFFSKSHIDDEEIMRCSAYDDLCPFVQKSPNFHTIRWDNHLKQLTTLHRRCENLFPLGPVRYHVYFETFSLSIISNILEMTDAKLSIECPVCYDVYRKVICSFAHSIVRDELSHPLPRVPKPLWMVNEQVPNRSMNQKSPPLSSHSNHPFN